TVIVVLALVAAIGSLVFTMAVVLAAPQVVAFVGLTHYAGGLDRAREAIEPVAAHVHTSEGFVASATGASGWQTARPPGRFRWVSLPMTLSVAGMMLLAV